MKKILLLVIIIIISFIGCTKDEEGGMDKSCWVDVQVKATNYDSVKLYVAAFAIFPHVVSGNFWVDSIRINGVPMNENMQGHLLYKNGENTDTVAILRTKGFDPRKFKISASPSCMNLAVRTLKSLYVPKNFYMEFTFNGNGTNGRIPEVKKYIPDNDTTEEGSIIRRDEENFGYYIWTDKPFDKRTEGYHFDSNFYIQIKYGHHSKDGNEIEFHNNDGTIIYGE